MGAKPRDRAVVELILHELRTPLNVASGSLAQLADATALSPGEHAHLERARRACASLELVARQLKDWTQQIDATPGPDTAVGPSLVEAVRRALAQGGRGLDARVTIAKDAMVPVAADPLEDAVQALVAAVLRAAADRSSVPVLARPIEHDQTRGPAMHITIGEAGPRGPDSSFDAEWLGGLGFSLPVARAVIESAGGAVWSEHAQGRLVGIGVELPIRRHI